MLPRVVFLRSCQTQVCSGKQRDIAYICGSVGACVRVCEERERESWGGIVEVQDMEINVKYKIVEVLVNQRRWFLYCDRAKERKGE